MELSARCFITSPIRTLLSGITAAYELRISLHARNVEVAHAMQCYLHVLAAHIAMTTISRRPASTPKHMAAIRIELQYSAAALSSLHAKIHNDVPFN